MLLGKIVIGDPDAWRAHADECCLFVLTVGGHKFGTDAEAKVSSAHSYRESLG